ncbi:MAG: hypothetical protein ACYCVH_01680 [Ignavibacteriaceae bacterium]
MKIFFYIISFLILLSSCILAQSTIKDTAKTDSANGINLLEQFFKSDQKKLFHKQKLQLNNSLAIYKSPLNLNINHNLLHNELNAPGINSNNDRLSYFKKCLSLSLAEQLKELNKYNLGEVGHYLGISRTLLAIILAVISLSRY